jgi:type V secretory pathway adhesin AidA
MDVIKKAIVDWLREILIGGIISNLSGMFDSVNEKVGEAIVEVGKSPSAWNSSIFNMVQNLSETVMIPIAGVILAFVMTLELIQLVTDRNNLHDRVFCEGGFSNTSNINDGQLICGRMKPTHTEGGTPLLYMNKRL